jgi:hypothetical protein
MGLEARSAAGTAVYRFPNDYNGYTFIPDGSGTLFDFQDLNTSISRSIVGKVYGTDFAYHEINGTYQQPIRYPVFGIVEEYSYYNYTPIYYNPKAVELVDGGYYQFGRADSTIPPMFDDEVSKVYADKVAASQSFTWAVFNSLDVEGGMYMVISINFAQNDAATITAQTGVFTEQIKKLIAMNSAYAEIPIFLGGNVAAAGSDLYTTLTGELQQFVSIQDNALAQDYASTVNPVIGNPSFDRDHGITRPQTDVIAHLKANQSVAYQALVKNLGQTNAISVFAPIVSDLTISSSNRLPLLIDVVAVEIVEPEEPETPEVPENPENPETPETPENPENPENPEVPETPAA